MHSITRTPAHTPARTHTNSRARTQPRNAHAGPPLFAVLAKLVQQRARADLALRVALSVVHNTTCARRATPLRGLLRGADQRRWAVARRALCVALALQRA